MLVDFYVGNIPFTAGEEDLRKLFAVAGKVHSIHLIRDHKTGQFRGCGYVKMADVKTREVIETLDGAFLIDRRISVSVARPHPQSPGKAQPGGAGRTGRATTSTKRRR